MIEIYKVLSESKNLYSELSIKRANLNQILEQRSKLRSIIGIFENDILSKLYDMIDEQQKVIKSEKENLDNIEKTTDKIKFKTTKLDNLKEENTSVEILAILKEYGVIETYDTDIIEEEMAMPELSEESVVGPQEVDPNMIVKVEDLPITMNIAFAKSKATTVMKRVGRTLGFISKPEVPKTVINEVVTPVEEAPKPVLEPITLPTMEETEPAVTQPSIEVPINKEVVPASNNNVVATLETKDLFPSVETPQPVDTKNIFPAIEPVQTVEANNIFPTSEPIQTMDTNSIFPTIEPAPATVKAPEEKADTTPVMPEMSIDIPTIKPLEQTPNVQANTMNINAEPVVSPVMPSVTNSQPSTQSFWPSMTNNNPEPVAPTQPIMPEIPKETVIPTGEYNLNTTGPGTIVTNLKIGEEK